MYYSGTDLQDVRYNCWEDILGSFDPVEDLHPINQFTVDPTWCPPSGGIAQEAAEILYLSGKSQYDSASYTSAKSIFEMVISQYPVTKYASASMKDLFTIEKFVTNDYETLKQYFVTNTTIQADSLLSELSVFLANKCEIELENWQTAIYHYEDIILNPETTEDSIFAIIDLGHVYFLIANSNNGRSMVSGNLIEHKPESKVEFFKKRDFLLSLLPIKKSNSLANQSILNGSTLITNINIFPNPTSDITNISFTSESDIDLRIDIYDQSGKKLHETHCEFCKAGRNSVKLYLTDLNSGIYFLSIKNGKHSISNQKLFIMK